MPFHLDRPVALRGPARHPRTAAAARVGWWVALDRLGAAGRAAAANPGQKGIAKPCRTTVRAAIEDYYLEERLFPPPEGFVDQAVVADRSIDERAERDVEGFWAEQARALDWFDEWHTVLEWDLPFARWFVGGTLNVSHNCLDRHVAAGPRRAGGHPLGGGARRHPDHHLRRAAGRRGAVRQRAQGPRRRGVVTGWRSTCP